MKEIIDALNEVNDEREKRSFVKLNLVSVLFTLVAILSLMVALSAIVVALIIFSAIGLSSLLSLAIVVLRWPRFNQIGARGRPARQRQARTARLPVDGRLSAPPSS